MGNVQIDDYYGSGKHRIVTEAEYAAEQRIENSKHWYEWSEVRPLRLFGILMNFILAALVIAIITDFKAGLDGVFWIGLPVTVLLSWILQKAIGELIIIRITGVLLLLWVIGAVIGVIYIIAR